MIINDFITVSINILNYINKYPSYKGSCAILSMKLSIELYVLRIIFFLTFLPLNDLIFHFYALTIELIGIEHKFFRN